MQEDKGTVLQQFPEGTLLYCPNCSPGGHYTSFGSITPEGHGVIMRKFARYTVIIASEYSLMCDCGYVVYYKDGAISTSQQGHSYRTYEK